MRGLSFEISPMQTHFTRTYIAKVNMCIINIIIIAIRLLVALHQGYANPCGLRHGLFMVPSLEISN